MGTRSLTKFYEADSDKPFAVMYRQSDGYPGGHGTELAEFLAARKRVNGISDETSRDAANGMGCLAAQCVAFFKGDDIGGVYLVPERKPPDSGEDYIYEVRPDRGDAEQRVKGKRGAGWLLRVLDIGYPKKKTKQLWEGPPEQFDAKKIGGDES